MRSAYNLSTIERTVQYFMKCMIYFVDSKKSFKDAIIEEGTEDAAIRELFDSYDECKDHEILLALIQFYLVSEIDQEEAKHDINNKKDTSLSHALYNHIKLRLFCLDLLTKLFAKISVEYECLREILSVLDKLCFISVVEMNTSIIRLCTVILTRISQSKVDSSVVSIIAADGGDDLSETRMMEKELSTVTTIEKIAQKVASQLQSYVYEDVNLGELKAKICDKMFEGIESKYVDDKNPNNKVALFKLNLVKDSFEVLKQ